jgi:hypothetical protein
MLHSTSPISQSQACARCKRWDIAFLSQVPGALARALVSMSKEYERSRA